MANEERKPLLQQNAGSSSNYGYLDLRAERSPTSAGQSVTVSAIGPDELPPPYTPPPQGGVPMVSCRVCGFMIDITGKREQHVVKCNNCNEATPIKSAPPGKKYVRCPCNCLLICKATSQRIACPRQVCKRIINLAPSPVTPPVTNVPGMCQVSCGHCHDTFLFNTLHNSLARCPHCRKVSSVGPDFARCRGIVFLMISVTFLAASIGITVGTYSHAAVYGGLYVVYIGGFIVFLTCFIRAVYFATMKVSHIDGPL